MDEKWNNSYHSMLDISRPSLLNQVSENMSHSFSDIVKNVAWKVTIIFF